MVGGRRAAVVERVPGSTRLGRRHLALVEPVDDGGVVAGGVGEGVAGQPAAGVVGQRAALAAARPAPPG